MIILREAIPWEGILWEVIVQEVILKEFIQPEVILMDVEVDWGARLPGGLMSDRDQMQFVQSCGCPGGPCNSPIMRSATPRLAHCAPARSRASGPIVTLAMHHPPRQVTVTVVSAEALKPILPLSSCQSACDHKLSFLPGY